MNRSHLILAIFGVILFSHVSFLPAGNGDPSGVSVHESAYNHYEIRKRGSVMEMRHLRPSQKEIESAVDLDDPLRQVYSYTATFFAGVFHKSDPRRVLMVGLGGGAFNGLFNAAFQDAKLETVEIDSVALELSEEYMGFRQSDANKVTIMDGRRFIKKTKKSWDWIILDAFSTGEVPFYLKTRDFYAEIRRVLAPDGILICNLITGNALYDADLITLRSSFSQVILFDVPTRRNMVAIASNYESPNLTHQVESFDSSALAGTVLDRYIDFHSIQKQLIADWRVGLNRVGPILTDDFAPVEYLYAIRK